MRLIGLPIGQTISDAVFRRSHSPSLAVVGAFRLENGDNFIAGLQLSFEHAQQLQQLAAVQVDLGLVMRVMVVRLAERGRRERCLSVPRVRRAAFVAG